jgi:hypothetical protein
MDSVEWTIIAKICDRYESRTFVSKKAAIHQYLDLLDAPWYYSISELKIYKNETEYTGTLNRFLSR